MMSRKNKIILIVLGVLVTVLSFLVTYAKLSNEDLSKNSKANVFFSFDTSTTTEKAEVLPKSKVLKNNYHVYQTFNNCASAALSMTLSYYGVRASQEELAESLRPYNNPTGNNDDKSTPPDELADKVIEYGLIPYFRADGDIETLKKLINADVPVIIRTLLYPDQDYAHYRVIKGYDDIRGQLIQDDSLEGKNKRFTYENFLRIWKPFNYGYLVLATPEKKEEIEKILGEELDSKVAWQNAASRSEKELSLNSDDTVARFNLVTALYYTGEFQRSVTEFEKIEHRLTKHVLWYQMEPIQSYFEIGNYKKVFFSV